MKSSFSRVVIATLLVTGAIPSGLEGAPQRSDFVDQGLYRACGINCLCLIAHMKGIPVTLNELRSTSDTPPDGRATLSELVEAAIRHGLEPLPVRVPLQLLNKVPYPAIAHLTNRDGGLNSGHFVVILGSFDEGVVVVDPPRRAEFYSYKKFNQEMSGAILAFPTDRQTRNNFLYQLREYRLYTMVFPLILAIVSGYFLLEVLLFLRKRYSKVGTIQTISIVAVVGCWICTSGCSDNQAKSTMRTPEDYVDLGVVEPGLVPFSIKVENQGIETLELSRVESSCTCTTPTLPIYIASKTTGELHGNVKVRPGPGSAVVTLFDPETDQANPVKIIWRGKVLPSLIPANIQLTLETGQRTLQTLEVSIPDHVSSEPIELLEANGFPSWIKFRSPSEAPTHIAADAVHEGPKLVVEVLAPKTTGNWVKSGQVKIRCQKQVSDLPLSISLVTHEGIRAIPGRLSITASSREGLLQREYSVLLQSEMDRTLTIKSAPKFVAAKLISDTNRSAKLLTVRLLAIPDASQRQDYRVVVIDDVGHELAVPIHVNVY